MSRLLTTLVCIFLTAAGAAEESTIFAERNFAYPNGVTKALILSYDDGPSQDLRFVGMLNKYGIKGTFHINSGRLGLQAEWMAELVGGPGRYVKAENLRKVYAGHEIASHTVNHPHLLELDSQSLRMEVTRDIDALEELSQSKVESFAYPFGEFDDRIVTALAGTGVTNARTVESTGNFVLPADFLRWHPTSHHSRALGLVDKFLALDTETPALFMMWGHSWEFDKNSPDNSWAVAEALCEKLSGQDDVWYVGAGEFARYVEAVKGLEKIDDAWVNESELSVWIRVQNGFLELAPR